MFSTTPYPSNRHRSNGLMVLDLECRFSQNMLLRKHSLRVCVGVGLTNRMRASVIFITFVFASQWKLLHSGRNMVARTSLHNQRVYVSLRTEGLTLHLQRVREPSRHKHLLRLTVSRCCCKGYRKNIKLKHNAQFARVSFGCAGRVSGKGGKKRRQRSRDSTQHSDLECRIRFSLEGQHAENAGLTDAVAIRQLKFSR